MGLYKKIKTPKFLGTLFILKEALLHLSTLSKIFQTGALNFARIEPAVQFTQFSLQKIKISMSPIKEFEAELNASGKFESLKIVLSASDRRGLETLSGKYIESLKSNIQRRFEDCLGILKSFSIFNPLMLPSPESDEFKDYRERSTITLANLFYDGNELEKEKLQAEWGKLKFDLLAWKDDIPTSVKEKYSHSAAPTAKKKTQKTGESSTLTVLEWSLKRVFKLKSGFGYFYPKVVQLAKVTLSAPISNAWPERGANAIKRIKTRLQNRLKNMLNSLLHISVNGPETGANITKGII